MSDWLAERTAATPARLALLTDERAISYAALNEAVGTVAGALAALGVTRGDRVALLLPTGTTYVTMIHALARLQAVLVPLNTRLTPAELTRQLARVQPQMLLYAASFAATAAALPTRPPLTLTPDELPVATPLMQAKAPFSLDAIQAIIFTSGTTGEPKGAQLTFANHFWGATASAYRLGLDPHDRWLSCLPLYHVGGLAVIFRACLYGTTVILHPRFDEAAFHLALNSRQVTQTSLVPTMLQRLLATRTTPWPATLRQVLLGGAAATPALLAEAARQNLPVATTYGMTEACSQVATAQPATALAKPGTVGKPLMFTRVRIVDEAGKTLPAGQIGEIAVRGPTVMQGYLDDPAATARTLPDGELRTGDMGRLDKEGDLWVVQRRSDIIISGGENIYPAEIEAALDAHPAVARSCVVGLTDSEWGQRVAAMVELKPGYSLSADELLDDVSTRLARYKRPRVLRFTAALPQTASGKVARQAVQAVLSNG